MKTVPEQSSDEDLACQAQAGSMAAFEHLLLRYEPKLLQFLRHKTRSFEDAEDLTQQTCLTAFRKIALYKPRYKFATWIFILARRQAIAHYRGRRDIEPIEFASLDTSDPAQRLDQIETEQTLWNWVQTRLPEPQFTAFWLRIHEDFPVKEIARSMGLTQIHIKVLLYRARQKLACDWPPPEALSPGRPIEISSARTEPSLLTLKLKPYVLSLD
jgi:RNA polymerase sigma-70 factor, ECF subfamily